jgi:hypothetical protein
MEGRKREYDSPELMDGKISLMPLSLSLSVNYSSDIHASFTV